MGSFQGTGRLGCASRDGLLRGVASGGRSSSAVRWDEPNGKTIAGLLSGRKLRPAPTPTRMEYHDAAMLDLAFVRCQFPALEQGWTLFDNAGGSAPTRSVIDAVAEFMARWPVQIGASYALSAEAERRVRAGHGAMAEWIGAAPGTVVLGPSTTANLKLLAAALRPLWAEGDKVVVTNLDHEANVGPWRQLEAGGIAIEEWRVRPETGALEVEDLELLLDERTRLVVFTHCSNVTGAVLDVAAVTRKVHEAGALVCVDGVAYAPHRRVEVEAWDVDFYVLSLYKTYGPHMGLLYGKRDHWLEARGQYHFFHAEDEVPYKLEPGNPNHELAAALPRVRDYFLELAEHHSLATGQSPARRLEEAYGLICDHEERLAARLIDYLRSKKGVRILGPVSADAAVRVPTISFLVEGRRSSEIPPQLDRRQIAVRWGHFYAYRLVRDLGLLDQDGLVRVSMVHYNTLEEVDRLISALDNVL